jgi:hypothetical protein
MATGSDPRLEGEVAIRRLADELFLLTDEKDWTAARRLFANGPIDVDMSSLGGGPIRMTADELLAGFSAGLHAGKLSHHMTTNYRVTVTGDRAELYAHGYAWNHVPAMPAGSDLWETWGTYRLTARRAASGWILDSFRYDSKLTRGNDAVRTHAA